MTEKEKAIELIHNFLFSFIRDEVRSILPDLEGGITIQYIHQLQNLYFYLTGRELVLKSGSDTFEVERNGVRGHIRVNKNAPEKWLGYYYNDFQKLVFQHEYKDRVFSKELDWLIIQAEKKLGLPVIDLL